MNEKIKNAWEYVKAHKKEICIVGFTTIAGVILYKTTKTAIDTESISALDKLINKPVKDYVKDYQNMSVEGFGVGELDDYFIKYNSGAVELMVDKMTLGDIGKLGEAIEAACPNDIPNNPSVWALLCIRGENET